MTDGEFFGHIQKLLRTGAATEGRDYDAAGAQLYDLIEQYTGDVPFYREQAAELGGPEVLELGCGTGRVLVPLAQSGLVVTGVDLSAEMLAVCRSKLGAAGADVAGRATLAVADMRDLRLGRRFGLVIMPLYTLIHLRTRADRRRAFAAAARHLLPGGALVLEAELDSGVLEHPEPVLSVVRRDRARGDLVLLLHQLRREGPGDVLVNVLYILINQVTGAARLSAVASRESRADPTELCELLTGVGLGVEGCWGDYDRGPLVPGQRGVVIRARKPGGSAQGWS